MNATALINGFLIYLLLMAITVGIALGCGFLGYKLKKKNMYIWSKYGIKH